MRNLHILSFITITLMFRINKMFLYIGQEVKGALVVFRKSKTF